jgi:hypothetical protein
LLTPDSLEVLSYPIGLTEMKANNPKILVPIALAIVALILVSMVLTGGKPYSARIANVAATSKAQQKRPANVSQQYAKQAMHPRYALYAR